MILTSPADVDEISFAEGDEITNIEKPDEGWWIGICNGKRGIFPKAYIQINDGVEDLGRCGTAIYDYIASMYYYVLFFHMFLFPPCFLFLF